MGDLIKQLKIQTKLAHGTKIVENQEVTPFKPLVLLFLFLLVVNRICTQKHHVSANNVIKCDTVSVIYLFNVNLCYWCIHADFYYANIHITFSMEFTEINKLHFSFPIWKVLFFFHIAIYNVVYHIKGIRFLIKITQLHFIHKKVFCR